MVRSRISSVAFLAFALSMTAACQKTVKVVNQDVQADGSPSAQRGVFTCNTSSQQLIGSSIRRIAKIHLANSLQEFLSPLTSSDRAAAMAAIQADLDQIPDDASAFFSRNDATLTSSHATAVFNLAYDLASYLSSQASAANGLASVCGAGSTMASLKGTCANTFVNYFGRKAFRRPLTTAEASDLLVDPVTGSGNLDLTSASGMTALLTRLFAHPRFYYRLDHEGLVASGAAGSTDAVYALSKWELLSKITFLFWDAPPSDQLYNLVNTLDLSQNAALKQVLNAVFADARAKAGIANFYAEWLSYKTIPQLDSTNSAAFKTFAAGENINVAGHNHRDDMIREVQDMLDYYTFATAGRYEDVLTSPYSFARSADLAKLYGMTETWDGTTAGLVRFPASAPRSGLLTRAAFLTSGTEYTRPIQKGKRIRFSLLCNEIPPPPPSLTIKPVVQDVNFTTRHAVELATAGTPANPNQCMTCHSEMNPLGFASEKFDAIGRYRLTEQKFDPLTGAFVKTVPVTTADSANLFPGDSRVVGDIEDLSSYISETGLGHQCLVRQFYRYTYGRDEVDAQEGCALENMRTNLSGKSGSLLQMFQSTVFQNSFQMRKVK